MPTNDPLKKPLIAIRSSKVLVRSRIQPAQVKYQRAISFFRVPSFQEYSIDYLQ